jgi:GxxExxY protein
MPVQCAIEAIPISRTEYHSLDYKIMGMIFNLHNDMGCLLEEKAYQNALVNRASDAGIDIEQEIPVEVTYQGFSKTYFIDIIVNRSIIYELKTVTSFNPRHRQQILNYLLLSGYQYGKLINFRSKSIKSEYVSTLLTLEKRRTFVIDSKSWKNICEDSSWLRTCIEDLLADWGAFLDIQLFYDAICFFRGGEEQFSRPINIIDNSKVIGIQRVPLLNPEVAIHITAIKKAYSTYEQHLRRFLQHTPLQAIQWINLNQLEITLKTLI